MCIFKLPHSWECVSAWDATRQHHNRLPLDKVLLDCMSAVALSWGLEDDSKALHLIVFQCLSKWFSCSSQARGIDKSTCEGCAC